MTDRPKRKFDASTPTDSGALRIRLDTRRLDLERNILGQVARSYEGINALAVVMWERHPCAVMCAASALQSAEAAQPDCMCPPYCCMVGRDKHAHWAIDPAAAATAGLDVISVSKAQQWETPWEVYEYVRERWAVQFDACASPLNALAPRYATSTDDFLARELSGETVFCNPPYAMDRYATGSMAAIPPIIRKLVEGDVRTRGCTAIALLPALTHQRWFHDLVTGAAGKGGGCHEIHWIEGLLKWNNPFHEKPPASAYGYPFVLCVWRPGVPPAHPTALLAALRPSPRDHHSRFLNLRRCSEHSCGKVRVLPRHMDPSSVLAHGFRCELLGDQRYASCTAHEYLMHFE